MSLEVRLVTPNDLDPYYEHLNKVLKETNGIGNKPYFSPRLELPPKEEYLLKFTQSLQEKADEAREQNLFLLTKNKIIIGNLLLVKIPLESASHRRSINGISVDEAHRGQSLSKMLLNHAIEFSRKINVEYLDLGVFTENLLAIKLYESYGFKKIAQIEDEFRVNGKKLDSLQMTLKL